MNDNNAHDMLQTLASKGLTLGCVESLTGGMFAARICSVPGASNVFKGGLITYAPELKTKLAFVKPELIKNYGVVSEEVALAMATGGAKALDVDVVVSCTGNAGPTAQEGEAPVGRVYLGLYYNGYAWCVPLQLSGDRDQIREYVVDSMINLVESLFTEHKNIQIEQKQEPFFEKKDN